MTTLIDPLTDEQRFLLEIVWETFADYEQFPNYFHVAYRMRKQGYDAAEVLYSFPAIGTDQVSHGYRAVGWWGHGPTPQADGPVYLTMAGLYHLQFAQMARDLAGGLLAYLQQMTLGREKILHEPFDLPDLDVKLDDIVREIHGTTALVERMAQIADHEWPSIRFNKTTRTGRLSALPDADCITLEFYLADVTALLSPTAPPKELAVSEPRSLLRTLNFLDVTYELIFGHALIVPPPMDRSSLLALDVSDEGAYNSGLVVLTDILRDLNVPGSKPGSGLLRLEAHLSDTLPMLDRGAVHHAVQLLDQIRIIRNSAVHPKPRPELVAAHHALGLPFPVRDFTAAWSSVRAHAEEAVSNLQEVIQAARP